MSTLPSLQKERHGFTHSSQKSAGRLIRHSHGWALRLTDAAQHGRRFELRDAGLDENENSGCKV